MKEAATAAELTEGEMALAAPGGVVDMIDAFADWADQQMLEALAGHDLLSLKIRARVRLAIWSRLEALEPHKASEGKAIAAMARPFRAQAGAAMVWRTADRIWTALGDRSTDENFYSKRAILTTVLGTVTLRWLADRDPLHAETSRFLDQRIDNVMQFERIKAQLPPLETIAAAAWGAAARFRYAGKS
jgi:ubiquinone biosynthesis protein COQ9